MSEREGSFIQGEAHKMRRKIFRPQKIANKKESREREKFSCGCGNSMPATPRRISGESPAQFYTKHILYTKQNSISPGHSNDDAFRTNRTLCAQKPDNRAPIYNVHKYIHYIMCCCQEHAQIKAENC